MRTTNRWVIATAGVFLQIALGAVYAWSVFRIPLANRPGRLVQESVDHDRGRRAVKRPRPRHHFVQHHTERPQVTARIHGLAARLFGRHVSDGAHGRARLS